MSYQPAAGVHVMDDWRDGCGDGSEVFEDDECLLVEGQQSSA